MQRTAVEADTARFLEELLINSWPALHTLYYDGWMIRLASGYSRRSNSVNMLYPGRLPLEEKVAFCEQIFAEQNLKPSFKMIESLDSAELNALLDERGYSNEMDSLVMVCDQLASVPAPYHCDMTIMPEPSATWIERYRVLTEIKPEHLPILKQILAGVLGKIAFVTLYQNDQVAAMGFASLERGYIQFHNIVTAPPMRGQGFGKQLMCHLIAWGKANGATHGCLQVFRKNTPAVGLYTGLGFREAYAYGYRTKQG